MSNDSPIVAEAADQPPPKPQATPKNFIPSVVLASIVGFCLWSTMMGLKHLNVFTYVGPAHQKLLDNPERGTSPAASKWQIDMQRERDADTLVMVTGLYSVMGIVISIALVSLMIGVVGLAPKSWFHVIFGCIAFTVMCIAAGVLVEWVYLNSLGLQYNDQDVSHETRFFVAEILLWGLTGFLVTLFSNFVFGTPVPWFTILPSMTAVGALGGGVIACIAMATALSADALAPNKSSVEVSALFGFSCAFLFGVLVWKALSTRKSLPSV